MTNAKIVPGKDGDKYVPYKERTGGTSVVYFTRDLSAEGLQKAYTKIQSVLTGKIAVKLHTGEQHGPNILPRPWVKSLMEEKIPEGTIVETNTYYEGDRYTTKEHRETLKVNGWTFCPVDIMDEEAVTTLPVTNGKWFQEMHVGSHELNYDSMLVLTHFKGHTQGGFGGSNKNIGIGGADGRVGKKEIHTTPGQPNMWDIKEEEFMERFTESSKATVDHFGKNIAFINVMRNMSVSCDCEGLGAAPVVTPNVGILASLDICAIDSASIDMIWAMSEKDHHDFIERVESRHGLRQLSYMQELGMGNRKYTLIDLDHEEAVIDAAKAVADVVPFQAPKIIQR